MPINVTCPACYRVGSIDPYVGGVFKCSCEHEGPWNTFYAAEDPELLVYRKDPVTGRLYAAMVKRSEALAADMRKVEL